MRLFGFLCWLTVAVKLDSDGAVPPEKAAENTVKLDPDEPVPPEKAAENTAGQTSNLAPLKPVPDVDVEKHRAEIAVFEAEIAHLVSTQNICLCLCFILLGLGLNLFSGRFYKTALLFLGCTPGLCLVTLDVEVVFGIVTAVLGGCAVVNFPKLSSGLIGLVIGWIVGEILARDIIGFLFDNWFVQNEIQVTLFCCFATIVPTIYVAAQMYEKWLAFCLPFIGAAMIADGMSWLLCIAATRSMESHPGAFQHAFPSSAHFLFLGHDFKAIRQALAIKWGTDGQKNAPVTTQGTLKISPPDVAGLSSSQQSVNSHLIDQISEMYDSKVWCLLCWCVIFATFCYIGRCMYLRNKKSENTAPKRQFGTIVALPRTEVYGACDLEFS